MEDERRTEARDAGSGTPANARVHNSIRSFEQKFVRERLRRAIALRNWIRLEAALLFRSIERVKLTREVGQEVDVVEGVPTLDASVREKTPSVKCDLGDRCLNFEACVPGATLWTVEASTERTWMGESRVHDVSLRHSQQQLAGTNCGIAAVLCNFPLVGCGIELAQIGENIRGKRKALKDTFGTVFRRDQPVGPSLFELCESWQSVPTPLRVHQAPHLL